MPGDHALVAKQWVKLARLVEELGQDIHRRCRPGLGAERSDHLVLGDRVACHQLGPGALLGPEFAQAQLAAVGKPDQHPRGTVAKRGALVEQLQSPGRHQVHEQRQLPVVVRAVGELDDRHLPDPPCGLDRSPGERGERWIDRLQRDHPGRKRRLDLGSA